MLLLEILHHTTVISVPRLHGQGEPGYQERGRSIIQRGIIVTVGKYTNTLVHDSMRYLHSIHVRLGRCWSPGDIAYSVLSPNWSSVCDLYLQPYGKSEITYYCTCSKVCLPKLRRGSYTIAIPNIPRPLETKVIYKYMRC